MGILGFEPDAQKRVVSRWLRLWPWITRYGKNGWSQRETQVTS